ncbi:Anaphase-promoting complex subunit 10 [Citrus sinensis]|uniref:Anaphase-promoting complex subunit 10 n=1 Tax=Citrus sinensis TaxID=2711 RepID=A0ACB8LXS3_CITSI|nr:Anaphase-promoting complex subunit 10 [Citrus sinensis]
MQKSHSQPLHFKGFQWSRIQQSLRGVEVISINTLDFEKLAEDSIAEAWFCRLYNNKRRRPLFDSRKQNRSTTTLSPINPSKIDISPSKAIGVEAIIVWNKLMATESSESEEEGKITGGNHQLLIDDDLREMGKKAAWSVSSCKPGNGVSALRDDNLDTYWQSDGAQPHLVNIQFQKKVKLQEIKTVELVKPTGWVYISLSGNDPRDTFVNTFMLQIVVLSNHLNGRDTHVRQIKIYGPRPNPIPHQQFQFTSSEFNTYSTVR